MSHHALRLLAIGTALGVAVPSHAVTIRFSKTDPNFGIGPTTPIFENFDNIGKGYASVTAGVAGPTLVNPSTGPANTANARVYSSSIASVARLPGDVGTSPGNPFPGLSTGNYAAVGAAGRYTVIFADYASLGSPVLRSFSVSLGSLSGANKLTLISRTGIAANNIVLTGFEIVKNDTTVVGDNYRVRFDAGAGPNAGWTGAIFESTQNAFEFDNLAGAAPEPNTWAMLTLGFGLADFGLRRSRKPAAA
jgi:hypothetical protein